MSGSVSVICVYILDTLLFFNSLQFVLLSVESIFHNMWNILLRIPRLFRPRNERGWIKQCEFPLFPQPLSVLF